jgi:hypothetical protein
MQTTLPHSQQTAMNTYKLKGLSVLLIMGIAVLCGCSKNVSVTGKIVFEDDKSPLTHGIVTFESSTFMARGGIKSDGSYTMGAETEGNGVPPGKYKVVILAYEKQESTAPSQSPPSGASPPGAKRSSTMGGPAPLIVSSIYTNAETTPLEIEVSTKAIKQDFEVKRP